MKSRDSSKKTSTSETEESGGEDQDNEEETYENVVKDKDDQGRWKNYEICCNLLDILEPFLEVPLVYVHP